MGAKTKKEWFSTMVRVSTETRMIEFKFFVSEYSELEHRDKSCFFMSFEEISDFKNCEGRMKVNGFSIQSNFTVVGLSFDTFLEETKLFIAEKLEFEYRNESLLIAFFLDFLECSDCDAEIKVIDVSIEWLTTNTILSIETFLVEFELLVPESVILDIARKEFLLVFTVFYGSDAKSNIIGVSMDYSSTYIRFSIENLMKEFV